MINQVYRLLSAIGYTHPIHPPIVHMTIGLTAGALFLALGAYILRRRELRASARHAFVLAFIFVFPTILLGVFDWVHFYNAALIFPIKMKMILAATLLVLLTAGVMLGSEKRKLPTLTTGIYVLAFLCVVGLGYFGGNLVFGSGVAETSGNTGSAPAVPAPAVQSDLQAGASVFTANCSSCHNHGGNVVEASLPLRKAPQLGSLKSFADFVRDPKMPDGKPGAMPAFPASVIDDKTLKALYDYIVHMVRNPSWQ